MLGGEVKGPFATSGEFRLPDYLLDDAFALRMKAGGPVAVDEQVVARFRAERKSMRVKCLALGACALLLAVLSLCISMDGAGTALVRLYAPWDAVSSLVAWIGAAVSQALQFRALEPSADLLAVAPLYPQVVPRAGMTLATLVCGALLAVAGMLYQTVFRNPIASPSLLGITNGVQLGLVLMFSAYGASSVALIPQRFLYGYLGGGATLVVVFALSKLITKRNKSISVFDMLVVGTVVSMFLGAVCKYLLQVLSTVDIWAAFFEFQEGLDIYSSAVTYAVLVVSALVALVPVVLLRFQLNLLMFSDVEAGVMGVNPRVMRVLSIVAGSIMILTAQVFVGPAASFALVVPFLSRRLFGSEFRKQLWGNVLLGMIILLACRDLSALIPFVGVGIPIGTIAGVITLPAFVWATLLAQKAWR